MASLSNRKEVSGASSEYQESGRRAALPKDEFWGSEKMLPPYPTELP